MLGYNDKEPSLSCNKDRGCLTYLAWSFSNYSFFNAYVGIVLYNNSTEKFLYNYHATCIHIKEKIKSLHGFGPVLINLFRKLLSTKHNLINFSCHELSFLD